MKKKDGLVGKEVVVFKKYKERYSGAELIKEFCSPSFCTKGIVMGEADTMVEISVLEEEVLYSGFFKNRRTVVGCKPVLYWYPKNNDYYSVEELRRE